MTWYGAGRDRRRPLQSEVRELHAPEESFGSLVCNGCDAGLFAESTPSWPCSTARLVYSQHEIDEAEDAIRLFLKWKVEWNQRQPKGKPSLIAQIWQPSLEFALRPTAWLGRFSSAQPPETQTPHPLMARDIFKPGETVTFTRTERLDTD